MARDDYDFRHEVSSDEYYDLSAFLPYNYLELEESERLAALQQAQVDCAADRDLCDRMEHGIALRDDCVCELRHLDDWTCECVCDRRVD